MYSFLDLEPVCCSMYSSNCCFLTYIQISQEADKVVWYSHLFRNFPQFVAIHSQRLWRNQYNRNRCFTVTSLLFLKYKFISFHWRLITLQYYFANRGLSSQGYCFSSSHGWMWELDCEESWALKNWWCWTAVLEKTLESPLDCQEIKVVHPKGDQSWIFIGRTDAEAEAPIFGPPDAKNWLIRKDFDAGKNWRQEKGPTEDEMVGWHHWPMDISLSKLWEMVKDRKACHVAVHGVTKSQTQLSD